MNYRALALLALTPCVASCGTVFKDRTLVAGTPIGGYGQPMGSPAARKGTVRPADVVRIDLPALIERYAGKTTSDVTEQAPLETAIVDFEAHYHTMDSTKASSTEADEEAARNSIVYTIVAASDQNCQVFLEYLHGNQVLVRSLSSSLTTIFTGAASVTSPVSAKNVLAALGTVSSGVGNTIDANAFSNSTVETIVSGIRADQAEFRTTIATHLTQHYADWPLSAGIADAIQYHNRCDAVSALAYLEGTANAKLQEVTKNPPTQPEGTGSTTPNSTTTTTGTITAPTQGAVTGGAATNSGNTTTGTAAVPTHGAAMTAPSPSPGASMTPAKATAQTIRLIRTRVRLRRRHHRGHSVRIVGS